MRWFVLPLFLVACSDASSSYDDAVSNSAGVAGERPAAVRTESKARYLVAELGGGGAVNANRPARGAWESFTLVDLNGGALRDGDFVQLRSADGHYLCAEGGGGGELVADRTNGGAWETFRIERLDGAADISSGDRVAFRASSGHYLVAELGGGDVARANRPSRGAWETFVIELGAATGGSAGSNVPPEDVTLVLPTPRGTVLGTVFGYEMDSPCPFADTSKCELPLYLDYNRNNPEWWDVQVQELLASRVNVVMAHGRGCYDPNSGDSGNGNMCPRLLRHLVAAIERAGAGDAIRLGMFDDTGAYQGTRTAVDHLPETTRFDVGDRSAWRFFWDHNMRQWFDTVPKNLWYRLDGRPVIAFWTLSSYFFSNQRNNASAMLRDLRAKFIARYGEDPVFIVDGSWLSEDPSITAQDAQGANDWFDPSHSVFTYRAWGGKKWGALVPSYRNPDTSPGCGAACREQTRRNGQALRDAFNAGLDSRFTLLEGWTNVVESAGFYRSDAWAYPNQYLNIVREYADPGVTTLKLEAESADSFVDHSSANLGGKYRGGALDIGRLPEPSGWFVGWTEGGESLTFKDLALPCGTYRFAARLASPLDGQSLHLELGSRVLGGVTARNTASWDSYGLVHLGEVKLPQGRYDAKVVFETGGVNLDWVFMRRVNGICQ